MALIDFLRNVGNKVGNLQSKVGSTLGEALIGKQEPIIDYVDIKGVDVNSPEFAENMPIAEIGVTEAPRVGGLLNDIRSGAKENFATGFAAPNWEQTITPDGRKKGLGYRFGEGLGSFARFAESPLGRGLIMAGIVGASGGSGLEALGYGTGAGLLNQQSRMKDSIYRNSLIEQGQNSLRNTPGFANLDPAEQQAQLDRIANQVNSYRGYLGDDTYKQVLAGMQLRDNAEYRNALLAGQRKDQEMAIQQRQAELKQRALSEAADRALKARGLDIQEQKLLEGNKSNTNIGNLQAVNSQLKRFEESFKNMPNKFESNTLGRLRAATGFQTENEANFNSQRQLLFNKIARDLGGEKGVLSDQDIKRIEGALPSYTDSMVQKQAKMQAIYDLLNDRLAVEGGSLNETTTNEGWAF
jgi:hypothetical protein